MSLSYPSFTFATSELSSKVEKDGFATVASYLDDQTIERLSLGLDETKYAQRNLLSVPIVRELAKSEAVRGLLGAVLGPDCFAVRGILFNKTKRSNWKVVWHQDLTIAVRERREIDGFGPWTVKAGVLHVQPTADVMARLLAIRIHLDDSGPDNGPLRVLPASHSEGRLSAKQIAKWQNKESVTCTVPKGGVLLMRPLLLHASSACALPKPRRVIHLEFAAHELPEGLQGSDRV
jgi:ectoine hydroxylase-related dioxygenase (phytanoyl-CoA dioxygenase family)